MKNVQLMALAALATAALAAPAAWADHQHGAGGHDEVCVHHRKKGDAKAAPMAHEGHTMMMVDSTATGSTRGLQEANAKMHAGMDIAYTGDADVDFLRGMIAHHQGAVDMAEVVLEYGKDPQVARMAREIIRNQNLEIAWMQGWLRQLDPKGVQPKSEPSHGPGHDKAWAGDTWMGER